MNEIDEALVRRVGDPETVLRVVDQMPLVVASVEGPDLRMTSVSGAYRALTGREDAVGRPMGEVFPELVGQQVLAIVEEVYRSGRAASLSDFRVQIHRPDLGARVELFGDVDVAPLRGPDGTVTGVIIDAVDVTARVREQQAAQRRVAEAERRYEEAVSVVAALQRELLPAGVPVLPGVQIGASYLLADAGTAAGGDWFDALPLADGRVALVVGDVVGHVCSKLIKFSS